MIRQDAELPRLHERLVAGQPVRIVAIGSSSTKGHGASSPDKSYPRTLEAELQRHLPGHEFNVVNRGANGELTAGMLERLYRDVLDNDPHLVIWQTGTNDALAMVDLDDFQVQLVRGIALLREMGVEVVLMDPQYYPSVSNEGAYRRYVDMMRAVAVSEGVPLFPRYLIMQHWAGRPDGPGKPMLGGDGFHLNDRGYFCVASALADFILRSSKWPK